MVSPDFHSLKIDSSQATILNKRILPADTREVKLRATGSGIGLVQVWRLTHFFLIFLVHGNKSSPLKQGCCQQVEPHLVPARVPNGLKETRSLSSLYERWYDPPWVCLNENIGKNHSSYNLLPEPCIPCHLTTVVFLYKFLYSPQ